MQLELNSKSDELEERINGKMDNRQLEGEEAEPSHIWNIGR